MMDTWIDLWIKVIRKALSSVEVDYATWWEDMCYCGGPLLSVRHFEEFMVPRYKRVTVVLKEYGVDAILFPMDGSTIGSRAGYPSVTVPTAFTEEGEPVGITFTGTAFSEPLLIQLAYAYEQATMVRKAPELRINTEEKIHTTS